MSNLPLHPIVVHLPIALSVLIPLVSAGIVLSWHKGWLPSRAFAIAALLQLLLVGSGFAAMQTGEEDTERVERVVPEAAVDAHEEAAEMFVYASAGLAVLFIAAALMRDTPRAKGLAAIATLGSLVVLGLGYQTGHAGGRLVYEYGAASAHIAPASVGSSSRAPIHGVDAE